MQMVQFSAAFSLIADADDDPDDEDDEGDIFFSSWSSVPTVTAFSFESAILLATR